jgi:hypothetical protein
MFRIKNQSEPTGSNKRKRSRVFVVFHDDYLSALLGRFCVNDACNFDGVALLIECRLPNLAVGVHRDGVFSWTELLSAAQDAIG